MADQAVSVKKKRKPTTTSVTKIDRRSCALKTLTPQQRAEVETLGALLTTDQMADYFGIGRTTFYAMMERDPDIGERYKKGRARVISDIAGSLIMSARNGCLTSKMFFLKTQAGWRETQAIEHSGHIDSIREVRHIIVRPGDNTGKIIDGSAEKA